MIDKIYIQKLRELDIMKVADALGNGCGSSYCGQDLRLP